MRRIQTFPRSHTLPVRERGFALREDAIRGSWVMRGGAAAMAAQAAVTNVSQGNFGQNADSEYRPPRLVNTQDSINQEPILPRLAAGEPRAMNECITRHGGLVWGIVRRSVKDSSAAEDLVQEVFTEIWKKAAFFDPAVASEATFIALVARRRVIDFLRRQGRQPDFEPLEAAGAVPVCQAPAASLVCDPEAVKSSIASLPDETRQLFHLFFEDGYTHPEIAEKTGLPIGTVKTRLRRGLITLREQLRRAGISNPQPAS
ncbi:MAG: sigma-70 family RNA polymerase sigma factor [Luteolibacter sp.]|jgi:RNA polymerase sigma-70 factor (ECF subfamily)|nr:sigma-70 family RNA polymerase sigma factor [Luteolibacter sp.]